MKHSERPLTIAANGDIVPKPYGVSRWHSPRRRPCVHADCSLEAKILARGGTHAVVRTDGTVTDRAHNCCGDHPSPAADQGSPP